MNRASVGSAYRSALLRRDSSKTYIYSFAVTLSLLAIIVMTVQIST